MLSRPNRRRRLNLSECAPRFFGWSALFPRPAVVVSRVHRRLRFAITGSLQGSIVVIVRGELSDDAVPIDAEPRGKRRNGFGVLLVIIAELLEERRPDDRVVEQCSPIPDYRRRAASDRIDNRDARTDCSWGELRLVML
jgi:hypothetical protein